VRKKRGVSTWATASVGKEKNVDEGGQGGVAASQEGRGGGGTKGVSPRQKQTRGEEQKQVGKRDPGRWGFVKGKSRTHRARGLKIRVKKKNTSGEVQKRIKRLCPRRELEFWSTGILSHDTILEETYRSRSKDCKAGRTDPSTQKGKKGTVKQ